MMPKPPAKALTLEMPEAGSGSPPLVVLKRADFEPPLWGSAPTLVSPDGAALRVLMQDFISSAPEYPPLRQLLFARTLK